MVVVAPSPQTTWLRVNRGQMRMMYTGTVAWKHVHEAFLFYSEPKRFIQLSLVDVVALLGLGNVAYFNMPVDPPLEDDSDRVLRAFEEGCGLDESLQSQLIVPTWNSSCWRNCNVQISSTTSSSSVNAELGNQPSFVARCHHCRSQRARSTYRVQKSRISFPFNWRSGQVSRSRLISVADTKGGSRGRPKLTRGTSSRQHS